jgi:TRAP-type mannitol/chloroaromatic compound transport system permease large subunit
VFIDFLAYCLYVRLGRRLKPLAPGLTARSALEKFAAMQIVDVSAAYILVDPLLEPTAVFRSFFSFISRYALMAIPLSIFARSLMERTGLVGQLFRFADALRGWLPGGFGVATVLACVLFGAISGSSVAMAAAMSVIAISDARMTRRNYLYSLTPERLSTAAAVVATELKETTRRLIEAGEWSGVEPASAPRRAPQTGTPARRSRGI